MISLNGFIETVRKRELEVLGVHVYSEKHGVLFQHFAKPLRRNLFSGSKAFTSMGVGIAEKEGRLSLSDRAADFFQELAPPDDITIRDLLQMRAGYGNALFFTDLPPAEWDEDWLRLFFKQNHTFPAGTRFRYDNGATYALGRIVETVSGEKLRDYLNARLFAPLGIEDPAWDECPGGHTLAASGLRLTTEEYAKLGRLMLQKGQWRGKSLVPAEYIQAASEDRAETELFDDAENKQGYGYKLWGCTLPGAYRADGKYGQYSVVCPDQNAVITITSRREANANDILRAAWDSIAPYL